MVRDRFESLSRLLSYVLRHAPKEFGLTLDRDGFVSLDELVAAIGAEPRWGCVGRQDLLNLVASSSKRRFEIRDGRMRALYGHTVVDTVRYEAVIPPEYLFHGTARRFCINIERIGLIPKRRAYVHLSLTIEDALSVGRRRDADPVVYRVYALTACKEGIQFYSAGNTYLSPYIPARYLERVSA